MRLLWASRGCRGTWPRVLALLFWAGLLAGSAAGQTRVWTDQDGRHYEAAPVSLYNDQATFQALDGHTFTLNLTDLVPADQLAMKDWFIHEPLGVGIAPPPTQTLSPFGRSILLDDPRVRRLWPIPGKGYLDAYLAVPLTIRNLNSGPLRFVRVYFFDDDKKPRIYPVPPEDGPLMVQDHLTTAFVHPADFETGQTTTVLFPLMDPSVRTAAYAVVVAGNDGQAVATVYPGGSWRDFSFPEHDEIAQDRYADYAGQELYPTQAPADLFVLTDVTRLRPVTGDHTPEHDYFRLSLRTKVLLPAAALSAQWYAFDARHNLLHSEDEVPYANPARTDNFYYVIVQGYGPLEISDPVPPTVGDAVHTLHLPGGAWWDKPEVDSIVFIFGTETKKVARVYSKSGATLADLPVPEKAALDGANPPPEKTIPERLY